MTFTFERILILSSRRLKLRFKLLRIDDITSVILGLLGRKLKECEQGGVRELHQEGHR